MIESVFIIVSIIVFSSLKILQICNAKIDSQYLFNLPIVTNFK